MHNFYYFFGLYVFSAITSCFGGKNITTTNSNSAISSNPIPHHCAPANPGKPLNRHEVGTSPLRSNGTGPLLPNEVLETFLSERFTKRDSDDFEDLEKRQHFELLPVPDPQDFPFNTVGFVTNRLCIGTLIGPYHVLVPAHCIHPGGGSEDFFQDLFFTFPYETGSSQSDRPVSRFESANAVVHGLWKTSSKEDYNLGLIFLRECPQPVRQMAFNWQPNLLPGQIMSMITCPEHAGVTALWHTYGHITNIQQESFEFNAVDYFDGSPIYKDNIIYGMVLFKWTDPDKPLNYYQVVRITQEKHDLIRGWIDDENTRRRDSLTWGYL